MTNEEIKAYCQRTLDATIPKTILTGMFRPSKQKPPYPAQVFRLKGVSDPKVTLQQPRSALKAGDICSFNGVSPVGLVVEVDGNEATVQYSARDLLDAILREETRAISAEASLANGA